MHTRFISKEADADDNSLHRDHFTDEYWKDWDAHYDEQHGPGHTGMGQGQGPQGKPLRREPRADQFRMEEGHIDVTQQDLEGL